VRLLGIVPAAMIVFLMAQVSPAARPKRGRADAGARADAGERPLLLGTDPPGRLRPTPAPPDGGASVERDAGPDDVQRELQQLRARLDALEQERAHAQQLSQQLQQLTLEVQQIRQQIADAEARRQLEEQQREERQGLVQSGLDALYGAQQRLAAGDWSIESELSRAQAAFTGQAQRDVEAARMAVQNRDLARARALLSAAILHAQAGR
jgi:TolA-binding protein